jgi:cytidylate kinase
MQDKQAVYSIAIDGPSGSGKSTLAKNLAKRLGFTYLDTGALYRAVGLLVYRAGADPADADAVDALLVGMDIVVGFDNGEQVVTLNGSDVSAAIRENAISKYASDVSKLPCVRAALLGAQKSAAQRSSVVMDGRDIGTVVLPDADVKIFLSASAEERAERRYTELRAAAEAAGLEVGVTRKQILDQITKRDEQDSTRSASPLIPAADAIMLDNTGFASPEQTLEAVINIIKDKLPDVDIR